MRRSTGQYVVLKKLAMGQTLYESQISLKSSWWGCQQCLQLWFGADTYIVKALCDLGTGLAFQEADQN